MLQGRPHKANRRTRDSVLKELHSLISLVNANDREIDRIVLTETAYSCVQHLVHSDGDRNYLFGHVVAAIPDIQVFLREDDGTSHAKKAQ